MIRKLLVFLFLISFFASSAYALENTTASTGSAGATVPATSASKLKEQLQLLQNQRKAAVAEVKVEAKSLIQAKRAEFKERIQTIKDQRKKALIEKIDTKLTKINQNQVAKFSEALVRFQEFLDKIKQSATDEEVLTDIATAQTAIDTAKTALDTQTSKAYIIEIVDDTTLKINAGTTVSQLRQDLTAVHKSIVEAKQAVQKLNVDRELIKKEATSSAK